VRGAGPDGGKREETGKVRIFMVGTVIGRGWKIVKKGRPARKANTVEGKPERWA